MTAAPLERDERRRQDEDQEACLSVDPEVMFPEDERPFVRVRVPTNVGSLRGNDFLSRVGDALDAIDQREDDGPTTLVPNAAVEKAKAVCQGCDFRAGCLAGALARKERFGVWGGLTTQERDALKRRRYRAERRAAGRGEQSPALVPV